MSSSNIVSLQAARDLKTIQNDEMAYRAKLLCMDKLALLEEMICFQEERSRLGELTPQMMIRGKYLFKALEETAETNELRILTRSYRRHLEHELSALKTSRQS